MTKVAKKKTKKSAAKAKSGHKVAAKKTPKRVAKKAVKKAVKKSPARRPAKKKAAARKPAARKVAKKARAAAPKKAAARKAAPKKAAPKKKPAPTRGPSPRASRRFAASKAGRPDDARAFLPDPFERKGRTKRVKDDLAEELGEDFVGAATSGESVDDARDAMVPEEEGGPFVTRSAESQYGTDTDGSNPEDAEREPFPTSSNSQVI